MVERDSVTLSHWERAGVRATSIEATTLTSILSQRERKKTGNLPESMVHFRRNPKSLALLRFFLKSALPEIFLLAQLLADPAGENKKQIAQAIDILERPLAEIFCA